MSNKFHPIKPPGWAITSKGFAAAAFYEPGPRPAICKGDHGTTLVVHGLTKPRADGEQWCTISVDYHYKRASKNQTASIDKATGEALRDLLCELYGLPSK